MNNEEMIEEMRMWIVNVVEEIDDINFGEIVDIDDEYREDLKKMISIFEKIVSVMKELI